MSARKGIAAIAIENNLDVTNAKAVCFYQTLQLISQWKEIITKDLLIVNTSRRMKQAYWCQQNHQNYQVLHRNIHNRNSSQHNRIMWYHCWDLEININRWDRRES